MSDSEIGNDGDILFEPYDPEMEEDGIGEPPECGGDEDDDEEDES